MEKEKNNYFNLVAIDDMNKIKYIENKPLSEDDMDFKVKLVESKQVLLDVKLASIVGYKICLVEKDLDKLNEYLVVGELESKLNRKVWKSN